MGIKDLEVQEDKIEYLTPKMVAEKLHIGRNKVYKLFNLADFPSIKLGGQMLVKESRLHEFMQKHEGGEILMC